MQKPSNADSHCMDEFGEGRQKVLEIWNPYIYNGVAIKDRKRGAICQEEKAQEDPKWMIRNQIR